MVPKCSQFLIRISLIIVLLSCSVLSEPIETFESPLTGRIYLQHAINNSTFYFDEHNTSYGNKWQIVESEFSILNFSMNETRLGSGHLLKLEIIRRDSEVGGYSLPYDDPQILQKYKESLPPELSPGYYTAQVLLNLSLKDHMDYLLNNSSIQFHVIFYFPFNESLKSELDSLNAYYSGLVEEVRQRVRAFDRNRTEYALELAKRDLNVSGWISWEQEGELLEYAFETYPELQGSVGEGLAILNAERNLIEKEWAYESHKLYEKYRFNRTPYEDLIVESGGSLGPFDPDPYNPELYYAPSSNQIEATVPVETIVVFSNFNTLSSVISYNEMIIDPDLEPLFYPVSIEDSPPWPLLLILFALSLLVVFFLYKRKRVYVIVIFLLVSPLTAYGIIDSDGLTIHEECNLTEEGSYVCPDISFPSPHYESRDWEKKTFNWSINGTFSSTEAFLRETLGDSYFEAHFEQVNPKDVGLYQTRYGDTNFSTYYFVYPPFVSRGDIVVEVGINSLGEVVHGNLAAPNWVFHPLRPINFRISKDEAKMIFYRDYHMPEGPSALILIPYTREILDSMEISLRLHENSNSLMWLVGTTRTLNSDGPRTVGIDVETGEAIYLRYPALYKTMDVIPITNESSETPEGTPPDEITPFPKGNTFLKQLIVMLGYYFYEILFLVICLILILGWLKLKRK